MILSNETMKLKQNLVINDLLIVDEIGAGGNFSVNLEFEIDTSLREVRNCPKCVIKCVENYRFAHSHQRSLKKTVLIQNNEKLMF